MIHEEFPRVKDLFFDIGWQQNKYPDIETEIFLPNLLPWQVLQTAWTALIAIVGTSPDVFSFYSSSEKDLYSRSDWAELQKRREQLGQLESVKVELNYDRAIPDLRVRRVAEHSFPYLRDTAKELEHNHPNLDERQTILRGGWNLSLDASSRVQGPVYFGRDVQLRLSSSVSKCMIGSPSVCECATCSLRTTGRGGLIGHTARVERSLLRRAVVVGNGASVGWSVVGSHVQIGTNTKLAQRRCKQGKTVKVRFVDSMGIKHKIDTGFEDFGFVAGDHCKIGVGVTIHHGVVLMPYCKVPDGRTLKSGVYYPHSFQ
ncbi:hypothetical protein KKG46_05275 [Patescibacteria group bacterium]|nr:hypothetical protein [Patescibacteria group bacterium]